MNLDHFLSHNKMTSTFLVNAFLCLNVQSHLIPQDKIKKLGHWSSKFFTFWYRNRVFLVLPIREKLLLFYKRCVNSQREVLFCTTGTLHGIDPTGRIKENYLSPYTSTRWSYKELICSLFSSSALQSLIYFNSTINQM